MRFLLVSLALASSIVGCTHMKSEPPVQLEPILANPQKENLVVHSVAELGHVGKDGVSKAIDAHVATKENWIGTLVSRSADNQKCTSTLIGRNTILTAAHCVDKKDGPPSSSLDISFSFKGRIYPFSCIMASDYAESEVSDFVRSTQDVALCKAERDLPFELTSSSVFEVVDLRHTPSSGQKVLLGGYGCFLNEVLSIDAPPYFEPKWDNSGAEKYRIGNNTIKDVFRGRKDLAGNNLANFTSVSRAGDLSADVCQGDSGGAIYFNVDYRNETSPRRIIGVVSGNNMQIPYRLFSSYTDLGQNDVVRFFRQWLSDNPGQEICGVNVPAGTRGCKQ